MRCQDIIRELTVPTGRVDNALLTSHLAACPECARTARGLGQLDAAWHATRAEEPSSQAFQRVWARANQAPVLADSAQPLAFGGMLARVRPVLALAAAVLVGAVSAWRAWMPDVPTENPIAPRVLLVDGPPFEAEPGQTLLIQIADDGGVTAENLPLASVSETISIALDFEILNFMESQSRDAL